MCKKSLLPLLLGSLLIFAACAVQKGDIPENAQTSPHTPQSTVQEQEGEGERMIRMQLEDGAVLIALEDNATADALLAQLPCTMTFEDYAGAEKISDPPSPLDLTGAPEGYDPELGDVTCYGPWGNVAIFYQDCGYASGLIPIGRVVSGIELIQSAQTAFTATLGQVELATEKKPRLIAGLL